MLTWKLFVPVAAVLLGTGITAMAVTLVQKGGFACTLPWYRDKACGIPQVSIPPNGYMTIIIGAVTKDGKKYTEVCPTVTYYDANNDKELNSCGQQSDNAVCSHDNPSKEKDQVVYVRLSSGIGQKGDVDVRGSWYVNVNQ